MNDALAMRKSFVNEHPVRSAETAVLLRKFLGATQRSWMNLVGQFRSLANQATLRTAGGVRYEHIAMLATAWSTFRRGAA